MGFQTGTFGQVQHRVGQMAFLLFVIQTGNSIFLAGAHLTVVIPTKKVAALSYRSACFAYVYGS